MTPSRARRPAGYKSFATAHYHDGRYVIVCSHVLDRTHPILYGRRDEPADDADSGWQFVCSQVDESTATGRIIAVDEILEWEPTVAEVLDLPPVIELWRSNPASLWQLRRLAADARGPED